MKYPSTDADIFGEIHDDTEFDVTKVMRRLQIDKEFQENLQSTTANKYQKFDTMK